MTHRRPTPLILAGLLSVAGGCAEQRPPIDKVQANALDKQFFVGEPADPSDDPVFFSRNFVVDSSESESLIGISSASGLERIRFDITEDYLFARRAYSVTNASDKGVGEKPNGDILAVYKIKSHFDVRKAYNASTGEELNVEEENTTDRPWNERAQFRVDWSQNLVNTPSWTSMFFGQVFGSIKLTPVSYEVSNEDSEDAPHFDKDEGYFDVTSHFIVEPETFRWGSFEFPLCFLMGLVTGSAVYSCDPQEAVVRTSFWRVDQADPNEDFEPFENTGAPTEIFGNPGGIGDSASLGIVTPPRQEFDPAEGFTDPGMTRFMNRHKIWRQSHQTIGECESNSDCGGGGAVCLTSGTCSVPCSYDSRRDANENGTDDQCENKDTKYDGSEGAQCSPKDRCTVPYRDREVKAVRYYMNPEMPEELQDTVKKGKVEERGASEDLLDTWNQALQLAVARAREVECRRTNTSTDPQDAIRTDCHNRFFEVDGDKDALQMVSYGGWGVETPKDADDVVVPCHNPVREYDPKSCGDEGYRARVGDLRHHFLIYWPHYSQAPYGGIGNWRGDPLTGQILGAAATTVGRSATLSAGRVRDILMVALGELDLEDILDGVPAQAYQQVLRQGRKPTALTEAEIAERINSLDLKHLASTMAPPSLPNDAHGDPIEDLHLAYGVLRAQTLSDDGKDWLAQQRVEKAAAPLRDSSFELDLVNGSWVGDALGLNPSSALSDALLDQASPLRGQDLGFLAQLDKQLMRALGAQGVCHMDQMTSIGNPDLHGLAKYYGAKYPDLHGAALAEALYQDLWRETYKGIQLHEVGHSLGLLHNFTSSFDSLNYDPQYWQLRTQEGQSTASCEGLPRSGDTASTSNDSCMGPRYLDPATDDELGQGSEPRPGIYYYGHTSTMEYQNTRFFETIGLGQYDVMAMGALYGKVLETFDPRTMDRDTQALYERLMLSQRQDQLFTGDPEATGGSVVSRHYTQLARDVDLFDPSRCRKASTEEKDKAEWRIVHGKLCAPPTKDWGHWDDFSNLGLSDGLISKKVRIDGTKRVPAAGNVRWPYRFGGDQMNSYLHVNPFDSGADVWEVTQETIAKAQYDYPWLYFRRQRRDWDSDALPSYTARLLYERLRSYNWDFSFTSGFYAGLTELRPEFTQAIERFLQDDNDLRPYALAQLEMFKGIVGTFLTPEPGDYGAVPNREGVFDLGGITNSGSEFKLETTTSRFIAPEFDSGPNAGGSWHYQDFARRAGYQVEKAIAARALTDGRPVFYSISRDTYLDSREVNINFRNSLPHAVDRLLGGLLSEDWSTIAPYIEGTVNAEVRNLDLTPADASAALPAAYRQVMPNVGYNQQVAALIFASLFGRVNGDLTLANKMRVWVDGSASAELEIPEAEQLRFTNPESGITYIARRFGTETLLGQETELGIGSRMLQHANELLTLSYSIASDEDGNPIVDEFGRPEITRDEDGKVVVEDDAVSSELRRYVGLLDASVQISTLIGYGPFNFF